MHFSQFPGVTDAEEKVWKRSAAAVLFASDVPELLRRWWRGTWGTWFLKKLFSPYSCVMIIWTGVTGITVD